MFLICIAIAAALVAWFIIPKRKPDWPTNPPDSTPPAIAWPTPGPVPGPFQASLAEKMAVVESELIARQNEKYRKQVIDEVADLVASRADPVSSKAAK